MASKDLRAVIVSAMMHLNVPTNLYRVMREAQLPAGTVDYWLHKLVEEGVAVPVEKDGQRAYTLQPVFYSKQFSKVFDKELSRIHLLLSKNIVPPEGVEKEKCVFATLLSILHVIVSKKRLINGS